MESGRSISFIIMRYNPWLSNREADGQLYFFHQVVIDCGTFHDLLMPAVIGH